MNNLTNKLIENLPDDLKIAGIGFGILALTSLPLQAQVIKGSEYMTKSREKNYCATKRGRETNLNKYKKITLSDYCASKSPKKISSKKYSPKNYSTSNYCISKSAKRQERNLRKIHKKRR